MLSKYFLERPVFAWVISIAMMTVGVLAIHSLSISQYPPIAPPSIAVDSFYPGASAETVENTVTQIIEQKMTGLDNMLYLSGSSSSSGASRIEFTFAPGTDPDVAWSKVQNKLQLAMASLPDVVQQQGVKVSKSTRNYLMLVGLKDSPFNRCKSTLKVLEAAAAGVPSIAAGTRPHTTLQREGFPVQVASSPDEWYRLARDWAKSPTSSGVVQK